MVKTRNWWQLFHKSAHRTHNKKPNNCCFELQPKNVADLQKAPPENVLWYRTLCVDLLGHWYCILIPKTFSSTHSVVIKMLHSLDPSYFCIADNNNNNNNDDNDGKMAVETVLKDAIVNNNWTSRKGAESPCSGCPLTI